MKAYLYRKAGAIGVATHWSTVPLNHAEDFEILGIGEWVPGKDKAFLDAPHCPYSPDIEQIFALRSTVKEPEMETVYILEIPNQYPVKLEAYSQKHPNRKFRVSYGADVRDNLNYEQAARDFGYCAFHAMGCAGLMDD